MAFLNEEPTARAEVIATLGDPLWEDRQERVLAYVWTTYTVYGGWAVGVPGKVWGGEWDSTARWALFVAYNELAFVTRHEVCRIGEDTPLCPKTRVRLWFDLERNKTLAAWRLTAPVSGP